MELLSLAIQNVFPANILLAYLLGMCSFLACSKKVDSATGLGLAVMFVLTITVPLDWVIYNYLLKEGALAWTGNESLAAMDLSFLTFICFIAVIAVMVQFVEMVIGKFAPALYGSLGIFLPLIAVNCAILGSSLFMVEREYDFVQSVVFGVSSGFGWLLAIVLIAAIRQKIRYSHVPHGLRGLGITMFITGLMAMAFMAFAGI